MMGYKRPLMLSMMASELLRAERDAVVQRLHRKASELTQMSPESFLKSQGLDLAPAGGEYFVGCPAKAGWRSLE